MDNYRKIKKILLVPDSVWGNDSGHRSTQFLIKTLKHLGFKVGVLAEEREGFGTQK